MAQRREIIQSLLAAGAALLKLPGGQTFGSQTAGDIARREPLVVVPSHSLERDTLTFHASQLDWLEFIKDGEGHFIAVELKLAPPGSEPHPWIYGPPERLARSEDLLAKLRLR